jgi:phosphofructokinase-like protein
MSKHISILTGGGDCPGLNTVIRSVVKAAFLCGWETTGILGGYEGLLDEPSTINLNYRDMDGLLFRGGTILGTANRGRFSAKTGYGEARQVPEKILAEARENFKHLGLDALICVGGDGSLSIAQQLFDAGFPVVGIPKTIDNDLQATQMTFGFDSAVACAVEALDRLATTAQSHNRIMVLEVMGRYAGWIAGYAGIAGGADIILIPEIPFNYESMCRKIDSREREGKQFSLIVVAEGAREKGGDYITMSNHDNEYGEARLGGIGHVVAEQLGERTGKETRAVVLGHLQRGGAPTPWDRQLCTRFGVSAVQLIADKQFGFMTAYQPPEIVAVPITEAIGRIRTIPPDGELCRVALALGISFGDG